MICSVRDCLSTAVARSYCPRHYYRWKRYGDPLRESRKLHTWTVNANGCWVWDQVASSSGYGVLSYRGKTIYAHRWVYEQRVGQIPKGMQLDHLCRNRPCVNPAHLEPVTQKENIKRSVEARTHCSRGHEYTTDNTYRRPDGRSRMCQTCRRERVRGRDAARSANRSIAVICCSRTYG